MNRIYVLDASGYLYRSYFAIRNMTNSKGESTNALFGFVRSVQKLMKDFSPDHLVAVFDGPHNGKKREELYPAYKAHRTAAPQDLHYQIRWAEEFCALMGIPSLNIPEVEADDTMGSIAKWAAKQGDHVYLCTSDKDLCQMVGDNVSILNTHKENQLLGPREVEEAHGVPPEKIVDYLAIVGDSSDNVPGLTGFGPKTAAALLKQFGSLDALLEHPESVPGEKKQEVLRNEKEKVLLSRKLVTLDNDVPIPHEASFFALKTPQQDALRTFYNYMGFHSLLRDVESDKKEEAVQYHLVEDVETFVAMLRQHQEICFDTETTSLRPLEAELVGIGFGVKASEAWYVPATEKALALLKPLFEDPKHAFFGHNVKYDCHLLQNHGIKFPRLCFDTMIASYILNAHSRQHSLDALSLELFGKVKIPITDLIGKGKNEISMRDVPKEKVCTYCCEDVDYTWRLKELLQKQLKERHLEKLLQDLEMPLVPVLSKMERAGIFVDLPYLKKMSGEFALSIAKVGQEIFALAGEEFNLNSPKQIGDILFTKLGIRAPKKVSTSADVLESLQNQYPIAGKILQYRSLEKLRSTYIDSLPEEINPRTKRIHCSFNQSVAATGRLSSQNPNLQNIPVRTEEGKKIRAAFRPQHEGWSFLSADYSQIELRILAHLCEDPSLLEAFHNNQDVHAHTAATVFSVPIEHVTKQQRYQAKAVNFGVIYGQQAFGLSQELGIDVKDASRFIELYFQRYKRVKEFVEECKEKARQTGKTVTLMGRERAIPEINSKNGMLRAAAERLAVNTPLQGTAADLIKKAMLEVDRIPSKGFLILQIHDELLFEIPNEEIPSFTPLVQKAMQEVLNLKVPLIVDIAVGKNWEEC